MESEVLPGLGIRFSCQTEDYKSGDFIEIIESYIYKQLKLVIYCTINL